MKVTFNNAALSMTDSADPRHGSAHHSRHGEASCHTVRLAQSELVTVDRCSCGTLSLHLGPMTLRVRPEGLRSIMETLGAALSAHEQRAADARLQAALSTALAQGKSERGQA